MARSSPRFDIEALRALAVVSVLLFHGGLGFARGGFVGVDVFFVISGYLIVGLLHKEWLANGSIALSDFWGRRARRLLPAATLVLSVTALTSVLLAGRLTGHEIRLDLLAATMFAANLRFAATGSDYWSLDYVSPALHFWSLGVEEQFYILTPLIMAGAALALKGKRPRALPVATLSALIVVSLAYCLWLAANDPVWAYYSPLARAWEFAAGGLMAVLPWQEGREASRWLRRLAWLTLLWSAAFIEPGAWPGLATVIPVASTAVLLRTGHGSWSVAEAASPGWRGRWRRAVAFLGGTSYSAYLWHWPVLWIAAAALGLDAPEELPAAASLPLIALSLLLAALTKRYVEDPWRFSTRLTASPLRSLGTGWATSGAAAGLVGFSALLPAAALLPPPPAALPVIESTTPPTPGPSAGQSQQEWLDELIADLVPAVDREPDLAAVTPEVGALPADKPSSVRGRCNLDKTSTEPGPDCDFGALGAQQSIALFGDSHADQYFAGIDAAARELGVGLKLLAKPSCPVADVAVWLYHEQRRYPQCEEFREKAIEQLIAQQPSAVVVASLVTYSIIDPKTGRLAGFSRGQKLWRAGLERTLERLTDAGLRVVLVRDLPNWGSDIADCLATYGAARCTPAPDLWPKADDLRIAQRTAGASALDLTAAVCEPARCYPVRGGTLVVRDDTHLSASYSLRLAPLWERILERELSR